MRALTTLLLAAVGCTSPRTTAIQTASRDLACPEGMVQVRELENERYRAMGCGRSRLYECWEDACWEEGRLAAMARRRAQREFGCPSVAVRWIQDETFRVEACGHAVTYDCSSETCVPEGAPRSTTIVPIPIPVR